MMARRLPALGRRFYHAPPVRDLRFLLFDVHDVPAPAHTHAGPSAGYCYPDGLPTTLPAELCAAQIPVPVFEGELPPPPRVSASVRAAWAEALAELEERNQKRGAAKLAAGLGGTLIVGGTAAAMLCVVQ